MTTRPHRVAVLVLAGAKPLDVGIPAQVFSNRPSMPYEVRVCGPRAGTVRGGDGLAYAVGRGLEAIDWAETIFVPGYRFPADTPPPKNVVAALRAAHDAGKRIAAISTGAFALAAAGLLDGRRATTHWHYTRVLRDRYPDIDVDEDVLFVDEGTVLTSAGAASGIDLCLHIVRSDHGVALANHVARRLVSAPHRSGGQAQYIERSVPEPTDDTFATTREWALRHLGDVLTVDELAAHANVSARTFSRRFRESTGYSPMQWVLRARVDLARELLEQSDLAIDQVAARVGLGTDANLRTHFRRILGTSPTAYRNTFQHG
ncbi:GlxA family transcriptional regulator [Curtobacterium sp. Leaf261]|uniref:GlxA family transcriptional regulator n=1 Tax=Curtobacterium sp. Leaf261 TaxID=1736311 RepID=UPI0006F25027|nr:helix-turn-helix domain-containing protein [Curtobacterium sp. Leaf261]KQO59963.1 AraC family transcriptional regulator [Curtobacterium sp. Leaf261]